MIPYNPSEDSRRCYDLAIASKRQCKIDECNRQVYGKDLCKMHWHRLRRHGDPNIRKRPANGEACDYLFKAVVKFDADECLFWPFSRDTGGRGQVWIEGKRYIVSRFVCEFVHGSPPTKSHDAAHSCGKGHLGCCNPRHLAWKTKSGNQADRLVHGTHQHGAMNHRAKLNEEQVKEIRSKRGKVTQRELADKFGIAASTISKIQRGKRWHR